MTRDRAQFSRQGPGGPTLFALNGALSASNIEQDRHNQELDIVQVLIGLPHSRWMSWAEKSRSSKTVKLTAPIVNGSDWSEVFLQNLGLEPWESEKIEFVIKDTSKTRLLAESLKLTSNVATRLTSEDFLFPTLTRQQSEALVKGFTPFLSSLLGVRFYQKMPLPQQESAFESLFSHTENLDSSCGPNGGDLGEISNRVFAAHRLGYDAVFGGAPRSSDIGALKVVLSHYAFNRTHAFDPMGATCFSIALARGDLRVLELWQFIRDLFKKEEPLSPIRLGVIALAKELLWREFFKHRYRSYLEVSPLMTAPSFEEDLFLERLTEIDDVHIRRGWEQLVSTGYISNRVRQWVASDWIRRYGSDCVLGQIAFEYYLIDFDEAINWGNWSYIAGQHSLDPKGGRTFNIEQQVERYDKNGLWQKTFS